MKAFAGSRSCWWILLFFVVFVVSKYDCQAVDITWTPNEEPRPPPDYSVEERQMIMQLDQHISQSGNPQAALEQVAASNQMEPQQLYDMIVENRQFMQDNGITAQQPSAGGGGRRPKPLTVALIQTVSSALTALYQTSVQHPRVATVVVATLLISIHVAWNAPRNGVVWVGTGSDVVRGPTTLWPPPNDFVESTILHQDWWSHDDNNNKQTLKRQKGQRDLMSQQLLEETTIWKQIEASRERLEAKENNKKKRHKKKKNDNKVQWHSDFSTPQLSQVAMMERTLDLSQLLSSPSKSVAKREKDSDDDEDEDERAFVLQEIFHEQAQRLFFPQPILSEFHQSSPHQIKFYASSDDNDSQFSILQVPGLGKIGAIGFIPFVVQQGNEQDDETEPEEDENNPLNQSKEGTVIASLVLTALPGTQWEGQDIYIRILQKHARSVEDHQLRAVVQVSLASATTTSFTKKKSHRNLLPKAISNAIVESLATSITTSLETRTQQAYVRQGQSARFKGKAKRAAKQRRETRASLERQMEEMAVDRRRRRFSQNPDQGRYRPTGDRMKSPNNAMY